MPLGVREALVQIAKIRQIATGNYTTPIGHTKDTAYSICSCDIGGHARVTSNGGVRDALSGTEDTYAAAGPDPAAVAPAAAGPRPDRLCVGEIHGLESQHHLPADPSERSLSPHPGRHDRALVRRTAHHADGFIRLRGAQHRR